MVTTTLEREVDERPQEPIVDVRPQGIPLTQDQVAIIPDGDCEWLNEMGSWYARWNRCTKSFYAERTVPTGLERPKRRQLPMHQAIWEHHHGPIPDGMTVDHADRNTLNNRLSNLRLATRSQQSQNRRTFENNASGYRGVTWHKQRGKWQANIWLDGKHVSLGLFSDKDDAARAYNRAAKEHYGEFALLNTIQESCVN